MAGEQSIWKKEISFSRKRRPAPEGAEAPPAPEPAPAEQSIWKKEISFRRKRPAQEQRAVEVAPVQEPQATGGLEEPAPVPVAAPALPEPVLPAPAVYQPAAPPAPPAPVVQAPAAYLPPAPPAPPEPAAPTTLPEPVAAGSHEPWEAAATLPPDAAAAASDERADELTVDPEPAAEPAAEAPRRTSPWWKREIGRGRSQPLPEDDDEPAAPFWRRDLKLGRSRGPKPVERPTKERGRARRLRAPTLALPSLPSLAARTSNARKSDARMKRLVGLKIGASQIAAARVANNGAAELLAVARQPLEQGVVVGGELRDPDALAEQLKLFFARNKLPRTNVRLGIASNRIGVRIFDLPGVDGEKALANAVQFRAQETLPIPLDEAVLDYHVIGESVDAEGNPAKRVLLVVVYRDLVERYAAACRKAGISLVGIDLEAFALLRALSAPRPAEAAPAAQVAVSIGHERSTFAVSDGRVCEFTRVLEWGGSHLGVGIARALDRAPSEVEAIKRGLSLEAGAAPPEGLSVELAEQAVQAIRNQVQTFARELVSSLQFYQNQPGSLGIGEIVLTGGTAHLPGLARELQQLIGVTVRVGDPLARLKLGKKLLPPEQLGSYTVAIGLGIED